MKGRDANELLSMPVVAMNEGKELGRVKDVIFDPERHALLGVMVTTSLNSLMFVPHKNIHAIGDSAITVEGGEALQEITSQPRAQEVIDSGVHLRGTAVLSETGNSLGTVDKVLLDDAGNIASYHASSGLMGFGGKTDIAPDEVISVGDDAIVVMESAEQTGEEESKGKGGERPH